MKRTSLVWAFAALGACWSASIARPSLAGGGGFFDAINPFHGTPTDIHAPQACENCDHEVCVNRECVQDCVKGEKKCYKSTVRKEYVSIPEIRYKYEMKCITKEIPCETCMPVCKTTEVDHQYQTEHWEKQPLPCGGERDCKVCESKTEKLPVVSDCETKPGKTTIKVHYWTCVKVPYTVYRQVEKEVGVKQPVYEHVEVPVARHVCESCGPFGCDSCKK